MSEAGAAVVFHEVSKSFGAKRVLRDVSFDVREGEALCILGRSGTGKSVTLKLIISLLKPDKGEIWIDQDEITCLKASGVGAIIAKSFARIYSRNCINMALPAIVSPEAVDAIEAGETVEVDMQAGEIRTARGTFTFAPLPPSVLGIFEAGGLVPYTARKLAEKKKLDEGRTTKDG